MIDSGATAFILVCTALVMLMTPPGVGGLFYGGLVRRKNFISMIALSFIAFALVSIQWVVCGYSLSFGADINGLIGSLEYALLQGVGMEGYGIPPDLLFAAFQMVFAGLTLAIVTSGVAERIKISSFVVFGLLWTTLVYDPLAHWAWGGGGWAAQFGALDFAGGTVVHISSGFSALALALVIGKRLGFGGHGMEPNNIPMVLLGGALLWFGWFGFNAGSALAADGLAANAFIATNIAAAAGALAWLCAAWVRDRPGSVGIISGAIAGLVAITPAAGFVTPIAAIPIGGRCRSRLLRRAALPGSGGGARREPRRLGDPRHGRHLRRPRNWSFCGRGYRRRGRSALREPDPVPHPGCGCGHRRGLLVRRDLRHRKGRRYGDGPAGHRGRGVCRTGHRPAR